MKTKLIVFTIAVAGVSLSAENSHAGELRGVIKNNQGVSRYEKGRPMDSYDLFTDALGELPYAPEVQYNIGNTFLQMKDVDRALKQYETAIRLAPGDSSRNKEVRFRALFNTAAVLASQNKTEPALTYYQRALEIHPDSIETKTNMELLLSQGGGDGKGDQKDKQQKDGEGDQQNQPQKFENQPQKPQPQPYKGKDLSGQDVDRILDELKQQEEQIRAKQQREGAKDAPPDKDW
jgi:Ca-activated chloride channel homolog